MEYKSAGREFIRQEGMAPFALMTPFSVSTGKRLEEDDEPSKEALALVSPTQSDAIFHLGIASSDPSISGMVLWTRINPDYWQITEPLHFQVSLDAAFTQIVAQGEVSGVDIGPEFDYTARIDTDGLLAADQRYYYRFVYTQLVSLTGRCRTLPAANATPDRLKLGVVSCLSYKDGYYAALHHLTQEDIDFVLQIGDFIYEYPSDETSLPDRQINLPSGSTGAVTLEDYRYLYRVFRSDPFLQEILAQHTFIHIWDDHETADNCYWDYAADTLGVEPDHPLFNNPAALLQLKLDAQRAWTEYVPARVSVNPAATHPHQYMTLWRSFSFGQLVDLYLTDIRTYRHAPPCGTSPGQILLHPGCDAQFSPDRTMLGEAQRNWLTQGILQSTALWKSWGSAVPLTRFRAPCPPERPDCEDVPNPTVYLKMDSWDGYAYERNQIVTTFRNAGIANLVAISGDLHASMAAHVLVNHGLGNWQDPNNIAGVEWLVPSVSSGSINQILHRLIPGYRIGEAKAKTYNPYIAYFNGDQFGYATVTFTPASCDFAVYSVDKWVNGPTAVKTLLKQLQVRTNSKMITPPTSFFIADLDGTSQNSGFTWTATVMIYVVDNNGNTVSNATVEGNWSNGTSGTSSSVTNGGGVCTVNKSDIWQNNQSVEFSVTNITANGLSYTPGSNHAPNGYSNGTSITVFKP